MDHKSILTALKAVIDDRDAQARYNTSISIIMALAKKTNEAYKLAGTKKEQSAAYMDLLINETETLKTMLPDLAEMIPLKYKKETGVDQAGTEMETLIELKLKTIADCNHFLALVLEVLPYRSNLFTQRYIGSAKYGRAEIAISYAEIIAIIILSIALTAVF